MDAYSCLLFFFSNASVLLGKCRRSTNDLSTGSTQAERKPTPSQVKAMLYALTLRATLADRHALFQRVVDETFRMRRDAWMRDTCAYVAQQHLLEFPLIYRSLTRQYGCPPERPCTFDCYATLLSEEGKFDAAIRIMELAREYGLNGAPRLSGEDEIAARQIPCFE